MRRAIVAVASTVAALVLLLSFKTHGTTAVTTPPAAVATVPAATTTATAGTRGTSTVAGDVSSTRYGPVQVQVAVRNGRVTAVTATQYPSGDPRSRQINAYAIPLLNREALQAGSARIDMISGATYTSDGYIASLQSALARAGLA